MSGSGGMKDVMVLIVGVWCAVSVCWRLTKPLPPLGLLCLLTGIDNGDETCKITTCLATS